MTYEEAMEKSRTHLDQSYAWWQIAQNIQYIHQKNMCWMRALIRRNLHWVHPSNWEMLREQLPLMSFEQLRTLSLLLIENRHRVEFNILHMIRRKRNAAKSHHHS